MTKLITEQLRENTFELTNAAEELADIRVSKRLLLGIYGVIPITLFIVFVDIAFFNGYVLNASTPNLPYSWPIWTLLFNVPHIIASLVTFADKEYLRHYKRVFMLPLPLIAAAVVIVHYVIGGQFAFMVFALMTMQHVISQQTGLTLVMLGKRPSPAYQHWRGLTILTTLPIYCSVYGGAAFRDITIFGVTGQSWSTGLSIILLLASVFYARKLHQQADNTQGKWYLWANVAMILACLLVDVVGYYAFVIVIPRVIHDISAFCVYITHDHNRNRDYSHNYIYRIARKTRLPIMILCPLIAIAIAYPLVHSHSVSIILLVTMAIYFHYYVEKFIWKGNSIHRQYVSFI